MSELIDMPDGSLGAVTLSLTRAISRSSSPFTFETQSFQWPGEQWKLDFSMPPFVDRRIASRWIAFQAKLKGSLNYFLLGDPSAKKPQGVATGTPLIAAGNQVGNVLQTKGWTPSTAGILLAGDYIQYGTGINARLHMVVDDADSDALGNANLRIEPNIRFPAPALNAPIVVENARGVFRLADNVTSWDATPGPLYTIAFSAVEVISA